MAKSSPSLNISEQDIIDLVKRDPTFKQCIQELYTPQYLVKDSQIPQSDEEKRLKKTRKSSQTPEFYLDTLAWSHAIGDSEDAACGNPVLGTLESLEDDASKSPVNITAANDDASDFEEEEDKCPMTVIAAYQDEEDNEVFTESGANSTRLQEGDESKEESKKAGDESDDGEEVSVNDEVDYRGDAEEDQSSFDVRCSKFPSFEDLVPGEDDKLKAMLDAIDTKDHLEQHKVISHLKGTSKAITRYCRVYFGDEDFDQGCLDKAIQSMSDEEMTVMVMFLIWEKEKNIIKGVLNRNSDTGEVCYGKLAPNIVEGIKKQMKFKGRPIGKRDSTERKRRTKCQRV